MMTVEGGVRISLAIEVNFEQLSAWSSERLTQFMELLGRHRSSPI